MPVWPVATYGCESRTLGKNEETRLDVFEIHERTGNDSAGFAVAKKTNEWVKLE